MGAAESPERAAFSRAALTIPFDASTCTTEAPAFAAATVAPPVYANRLSTFMGLPAFFMREENHSQFTACSGKSPVCLKPMGLILNLSPSEPYSRIHSGGRFDVPFQAPPPLCERIYEASALFHSFDLAAPFQMT